MGLLSKEYVGSPDILICGNCREMFSDLVDMIDHKKFYCKLRFTCKCDITNEDGGCNSSSCIASDGIANATNSQTDIAEISNGPAMERLDVPTQSTVKKKCNKNKYLHCITCKSPFSNAWDLMVHVQTAHMMNIYLLADSSKLQQQKEEEQQQQQPITYNNHAPSISTTSTTVTQISAPPILKSELLSTSSGPAFANNK